MRLPAHIANDLQRSMDSTEIWDHENFLKSDFCRNKKIWVSFLGKGDDELGRRIYEQLLEDSKKRHGQVYKTKQLVTNIDAHCLRIDVYFSEEKGKHKLKHFKVSGDNKRINANFCLDNCELLIGEIDGKNRQKVKNWFFNESGKQMIEQVLAKEKP